MATIGTVTKHDSGHYEGELRTLSIRADITIMPVTDKATHNQPDFRVLSKGVEVGAGWLRIGQMSGKEYVSLSISAPELGSKTPYANSAGPRVRPIRTSTPEEADPVQQTLRVSRLKTLERLGLAKERQQGVWALDAGADRKLRQLGERADKFKMTQRALKEAGSDRAAASMALFERGPRKTPLIGKVVGVGLVDEITDRTWVVIDAVDGRVHYAELGRLQAGEGPARGMLVALGGDSLQVNPSSHPRLQVLSPVELGRHAAYDGPTWLDQAILSKWRPDGSARGFAAEVASTVAARGRWLVARQLAEVASGGDIVPKPDMMRRLRQAETERLAADLSRRLNASYLPAEPGRQICRRL